MRPLFDSDVLIRALNGTETTRSGVLLLGREALPISIITWMEVMAGATSETEERTRRFLSRFLICDITVEIAEKAVQLRKTMKLKLPDAIIYATALATGRILITHNVRDYPEGTESVMIPL